MTAPSVTAIRDARVGDAATIADLAHRTFRQTYGAQTEPEDMDAFLAGAYIVDDIAAKLVDERHRYLIAEADSVPAGFTHLVMGEGNPSVSGERPVLLAEIYLDRAQQGIGLGAAMMQRAIDEARAGGGDVLWLGVWEHNARAIGFYERWGFRPVGEMPFLFGSEQQRDIVMALPL